MPVSLPVSSMPLRRPGEQFSTAATPAGGSAAVGVPHTQADALVQRALAVLEGELARWRAHATPPPEPGSPR